MTEYWIHIFATAIKARIERENRTVDDILAEYTLVSESDKQQIRNELGV